MKIIRVNKHL